MACGAGGAAMTVPSSSNVDAIAARVRDARASATPLRIVGAGTWLDAGRPCTAAERLDLSGHAGVVDYVPGDLTLTARAGTTLTEIARVTRAEGQWLTMDPHGSPSATLGATVATASAGPLSSAYGTPRDQVLGCEFVSGTGDVVRAGGRVVKNVAGFDLVRLATGSWGTLGALTEISVRLRARPEADESMVVAGDSRSAEAFADATASWLRGSAMTPLCAELLSPSLARRLGHEDGALLLRWGGNAAFTRAAVEEASGLGAHATADASVWSALASAEPVNAIVFRVSALPSRIGSLWARASAFAERAGGHAHATVTRGVVRCVIPADAMEPAQMQSGIAALVQDVTAIGERLPAHLWPAFTRARTTGSLLAGVKRAFDPDGLMNPGILALS